MLYNFDSYVDLLPKSNNKKTYNILCDLNDKDKYNPHNILPFLNNENTIINNNHLSLKKSKIDGAGYGVYTNKSFKIDDIIEVAPALRVQTHYLFQRDNALNDYIFKDPLDDDFKLIALGYGSMYNHSDLPNLRYFYQDNKMIYQAIKDILAEDELYISYGSNWWISRDKPKI